jgi:hypothetical protein
MLEDLRPPVKKHSCKVQTVASGLSPKDAEILIKAVLDPIWGFKTLSNELAQRGLVLTDLSIARHRRQQCACFRK